MFVYHHEQLYPRHHYHDHDDFHFVLQFIVILIFISLFYHCFNFPSPSSSSCQTAQPYPNPDRIHVLLPVGFDRLTIAVFFPVIIIIIIIVIIIIIIINTINTITVLILIPWETLTTLSIEVYVLSAWNRSTDETTLKTSEFKHSDKIPLKNQEKLKIQQDKQI